MDLLLLHIQRKAFRPGNSVMLDKESDFPLVYAQSPSEFVYYLKQCMALGLVEHDSNNGYRLGLKGWERLAELKKTVTNSDKAFVAMWFDESMTDVYLEAIKPALEETGYNPIRIDFEHHNERVDDRIIAEIRTSGLVVADFTQHRGGVYFEAGYALGLGIPLIWTCRKNQISKAHFDTRQFNHIVWESKEELKQKLIDRINATHPRPL
jgi:nucleoside 2-deoxyribosyltransferase